MIESDRLASNVVEKCIDEDHQQCFIKCGFDVGNISIINKEIDTEFQELFAQISIETTLDEFINFDAEIITSEAVGNPTHIDWREKCQKKELQRSFYQKILFN